MPSEGWEWLKDQPPKWEAPDDLHAPTVSPALNLGVQVIGSNIAGNDIVEVTAEFLAAEARLELWMGRLDPPLPLRRRFEVGRETGEAVRTTYEAWIDFQKAHRAAGGRVAMVGRERSRLIAAFREATAVLKRAVDRGTGEGA